ncbi:MAG: hypothetical protein ACSHX0_13515 [Akkermansiaceae bacterium]
MPSIVPEGVIKHYRDTKSLVSITRDSMSSESIQGFVVDYDASYILFAYIYDFHADGFLILRREDLSSMNCRATDAFQHSLLVADQVIKTIDFSARLHPKGILAHLTDIPVDRVVILEDESEDDNDIFLIGLIDSIIDKTIKIKCFSGAGRWDDDISEIDIDEVTSVTYSSNYTNSYERYFRRE